MAKPQNEKTACVEKELTGVIDHSFNEGEDEFYIDLAKESKLLAKLDLAFVPIIMLLYLSSFLDRSNIGMFD